MEKSKFPPKGFNWIRAKDQYPKDGQKVIYWFEHLNGTFEGAYAEETKILANGETHINHIFLSDRGYLTDEDVYWIPLKE